MIRRLNIWKALSRDRLRKEAEARRREIAAADRAEALKALQNAEQREDTRDIHYARQRAIEATTRALAAELGR